MQRKFLIFSLYYRFNFPFHKTCEFSDFFALTPCSKHPIMMISIYFLYHQDEKKTSILYYVMLYKRRWTFMIQTSNLRQLLIFKTSLNARFKLFLAKFSYQYFVNFGVKIFFKFSQFS